VDARDQFGGRQAPVGSRRMQVKIDQRDGRSTCRRDPRGLTVAAALPFAFR
jgi:hypothetical protein